MFHAVLGVGILSSFTSPQKQFVQGVLGFLNMGLTKYILEHFSLLVHFNVLRQFIINPYAKEVRRIHNALRVSSRYMEVSILTHATGLDQVKVGYLIDIGQLKFEIDSCQTKSNDII